MIIYKENKKDKGETYYISYPSSEVVLTIDEIESLLMIFANKTEEHNELILDVLSLFREYEHLKKGKTYEVVLKGNQLCEAFLSENFESSIVEDNEPNSECSESQSSFNGFV